MVVSKKGFTMNFLTGYLFVLFLINALFTAVNVAIGANKVAIGTAATAAFCAVAAILSLAGNPS